MAIVALRNEHLCVVLAPNGGLQRIQNLAADENYPIEADAFTLVTDRGTLSNRDSASTRTEAAADHARYTFSLPGCCEVTLEYHLQPGRKCLERHLTVANGPQRLLLERIELGRTVFATAPREFVQYDTFWYAPTASFLRWENGGLFAGIENPFFATTVNGREFAHSFEPALWLKPGEIFRSEPQFFGAYRRSGRMIAEHWPRTVVSSREGTNRPRFRNPCGHVPLDWNEIQGMRQFALDYLAPRQDRFLSLLYMYWYPIGQLPDSPEMEARYKRVIDNFRALGGDMIIFNPLVRYERPTGDLASSWNLAPEGSTAQRILRHADDKGVQYGFYMGLAAQGDRGNACNLPFVPERPEWKRVGPLGGVSSENCLACDEFAEWWYAVQRNTIARHDLRLWAWDPGPGHGLYCYSDQHGHVPGKGGYKGWRNSLELLRRLKAEFPDLFLMAYYGRKECGLWGLKYFDQHEAYWEQTVFYGASLHAELHDDRVNADGARLQNWWNANFRFLPTVMNHALTHRIGENSYDARLPQVWDHLGWRYSLMSGIASGGSVTACILPEDVGLVPGMPEFYARWLGWARKYFEYVQYNVALGDQVRPGGIDIWARIKGDRGFLFLCNPAPRPARKELALDDQIGLCRAGQFTLKELYPREDAAWCDPVQGRSVFAAGEKVTIEVPEYEVLLLELAPARPDEVNARETQFHRPADNTHHDATRMLDDWRTDDGQPFSFPFHPPCEKLTLRTRFQADRAIQAALTAATPANLAEIAPLVEQWRHDRGLPHSYVWARPDRLWLVLPFTDAGRVGAVLLENNGTPVPVHAFSVADARVIYYADLTDVIHWSAENTLTLQLSDLGANQFLGAYLDYPPLVAPPTDAAVASPVPRVVYDRPIDPDMPGRCGEAVAADNRRPTVLGAAMNPPLVGGTPEIVFTASVDLPPKDLLGVYLSVGWLGADVRMAYDDGAKAWSYRCPTPGRFPILDGDAGHVWAIAKSGRISDDRSFSVKWDLGGFSPKGAAAALASPWPHVRSDALAALAVCSDPRAASLVRDRLAQATDPHERRLLAATVERLCRTLGDKTLVAWVYPANLVQRGGSVLSIEKLADQGTPDFDAIVLGEIAPGKWMPGSGAFRRTPQDQATWPEETAGPGTPVQLVIVYRGEQLTMYRNGRPYAQYPIQPTGFGPSSLILIGKRHLEARGACWFAGAVEEARLYDIALDAEAVAALRPDEVGEIKPWAQWTFEHGTQDTLGRFSPGVLRGHARVADGKLHLDGTDSFMLIENLEGPQH